MKSYFIKRLLGMAERTYRRLTDKQYREKEHGKTSLPGVIGALFLGLLVGIFQGPHRQRERKQDSVAEGVTQAQPVQVQEQRKIPLPKEQRRKFTLSPGVILELLKDTFQEWNEDKAPQLAAALAYYTVFSMAPLLIIVIAVAGLAFGQDAAQNKVVEQIGGLIGTEGAQFLQSMIQAANKPAEGTIATILGIVALIGGAVGVMTQLKTSLNTIWNVPPKKGPGGIAGILQGIKSYVLSFTLVLGIGFLLMVALVVSAGISAVSGLLDGRIPEFLYQLLNFVISFGVITVLFALMYKVLPDIDVSWKDVWLGAAFTSLLFNIGKLLIGLYLGHSSIASTYGAAGSLVIILLWIYYSAQILFFGAELTQVYANRYGDPFTQDKRRQVIQQQPVTA